MGMNTTLKLAILEQNTTQKAVAKAAGLNPSIMSGIIRGWYNATVEQKEAIARVLGRPVHELFAEVAA
jgi:DNA-binding XRE family transcriptional regulator